jgi:hypothetical protein
MNAMQEYTDNWQYAFSGIGDWRFVPAVRKYMKKYLSLS